MSNPVVITDSQGHERVRIGEIVETAAPGAANGGGDDQPVITASGWGMLVKNTEGADVIEIGEVAVGSTVASEAPIPTSTVSVGGGGANGQLSVRDANGEVVVEAKVTTHQPQGSGSIIVTSGLPQTRVQIDGGIIALTAADSPPSVRLSALGQNAVEIHDAAGRRVLAFRTEYGAFYLGAKGREDSVELNGGQCSIFLRDLWGNDRINLAGFLGTIQLNDGTIRFNKLDGTETITLDGQQGDIVLHNADCAEEFETAGAAEVDPGTVMVIDEDGRLRPSAGAYDRRVAGVISGAGERRPAITLGRTQSTSGRAPVALVGRVFCKADASEAPIEVGDLLTTAPRTGHAMKATDPARAFGSVLGKALAPLPSATGLIPILVTLQ